MNITKLIYLLPIITLILNACSVIPTKESNKNPNSLNWYQHQQEIKHLNQYKIRGTLIYFSNQQRVYSHFFWQQTSKDNYRLLLINIMGNIDFELDAQLGQVQIKDNKGQYYISNDAEKMISNITGMLIPFNGLREWILGIPYGTNDYKLDDHYYLNELNYVHNGKTWKVIYNDYNTKNKLALPSSVELIQDNKHIKLIIDNWILK